MSRAGGGRAYLSVQGTWSLAATGGGNTTAGRGGFTSGFPERPHCQAEWGLGGRGLAKGPPKAFSLKTPRNLGAVCLQNEVHRETLSWGAAAGVWVS